MPFASKDLQSRHWLAPSACACRAEVAEKAEARAAATRGIAAAAAAATYYAPPSGRGRAGGGGSGALGSSRDTGGGAAGGGASLGGVSGAQPSGPVLPPFQRSIQTSVQQVRGCCAARGHRLLCKGGSQGVVGRRGGTQYQSCASALGARYTGPRAVRCAAPPPPSRCDPRTMGLAHPPAHTRAGEGGGGRCQQQLLRASQLIA